jgi:hypothetical protein
VEGDVDVAVLLDGGAGHVQGHELDHGAPPAAPAGTGTGERQPGRAAGPVWRTFSTVKVTTSGR